MSRIAGKRVSASSSPLSPKAMRQAGVAIEDALWFARIPNGAQRLQALRTPTGQRILDALRGLHLRLTTGDAMPHPA